MAESVVLRLGIDARGAASGSAKFVKAGEKIASSATKVDQRLRKVTGSMKGLGAAATSARGTIASLFGGITGALVIRSGVQAIASFERSISILGVVTEATEKQLGALSAKARDLGADTQFTANQVARGMLELGRVGFKTNEILSAIPHTLDLAIVAEGNLAEVSKIAASTMRAFRLEAEDMIKVVDTLTHTANSSGTTVQELGQAMRFVGPAARAFGASVEETAAFLGVLADNNLRATLGGTALRAMFVRLQKPTGDAIKGLEMLGLTVRDVNPQVQGITGTFEALAEAIERVGPEQALRAFTKLFGRRQISGALIGVVPESIVKLKGLQEEMKLLDRATSRAARTIEDTLVGAFFELKAAMEAISLTAGQSGLLGGMRSLVDTLTDVARALAGMTEKIEGNKESIIAVAEWVKTLGLVFATTFSLRILGVIGKFALGIKGLVAAGTLGAAATLATSFEAIVGALKLIAIGLLIFRDRTIEVGGEVFTLAELTGVAFKVITDIVMSAGNVISDFFRNTSEAITTTIEENASLWAKTLAFFDDKFRNFSANLAFFKDQRLGGQISFSQITDPKDEKRAREIIGPERVKQLPRIFGDSLGPNATLNQKFDQAAGLGLDIGGEIRSRTRKTDKISLEITEIRHKIGETEDFLLHSPKEREFVNQRQTDRLLGLKEQLIDKQELFTFEQELTQELRNIKGRALEAFKASDENIIDPFGVRPLIDLHLKELSNAKAKIANERADRFAQQETDRIEAFTDTHPFLTEIQRSQSFGGITSADLVADTFAPGFTGESQLAELEKLERKAREAHNDRMSMEKEFRDAILDRATVENNIEDIIIRIHQEKHELLLTEDQLFKMEELRKVEAELMIGIFAEDEAGRKRLVALVGEELDVFIKARREREEALRVEKELASAREKGGEELQSIIASLADELFILKALRADPSVERNEIEQMLHLERTAVREVTGQYLLLEEVIDRLSNKQIKGIRLTIEETENALGLNIQEQAKLDIDKFDIARESRRIPSRSRGAFGELQKEIRDFGVPDFEINIRATTEGLDLALTELTRLEKQAGKTTDESERLRTELTDMKKAVPALELAASSAEFLSQTIGGPLSNALTDIVAGVATAGEAFRNFAVNVLSSIVQTLIQAMIDMLVKLIIQMAIAAAFGGVNPFVAIAAVPSRQGNVFTGGEPSGDLGLKAFAEGGTITKPTRALMGEAGPEAVLPLKRGGDGKLGVTVHGLLSEELATQRTFQDLNVLTLRDIADNIKSQFAGLRDEIRAWRQGTPAAGEGLLGKLLFGVRDIPAFSDGGLVTQPTLAVIGEEGPELITPVRDLHRPNEQKESSEKQQRPIIINFNLPKGTNPESFRRSQSQIAGNLRRIAGGFG